MATIYVMRLFVLSVLLCLNDGAAVSSSTDASGVLSLLSTFPDLSEFTDILHRTYVAEDLGSRGSVTILAVTNSYFNSSSDLSRCLTSSSSANVFLNQILLEYISVEDLGQIAPTGRIVATLYQTSGRADEATGTVNITRRGDGVVHIRSAAANAIPNVFIVGNVTSVSNKVGIFTVDSLLVPCGFDLIQSESQPSVNITQALINAHDFMVAASLWEASGASRDCEQRETGAGITLFIPTDEAFGKLPTNVGFRTMAAPTKLQVLKFHVLNSYYPFGSLESIVNPVQPTLATEIGGAESFTLNISRVNRSVLISTGIVQASITQTVFDQKPVVIFGVSEVLLPKEFFDKSPITTAPPDFNPSPVYSPEVQALPNRQSSPADDVPSANPVVPRHTLFLIASVLAFRLLA